MHKVCEIFEIRQKFMFYFIASRFELDVKIEAKIL